MVKDDLKCPWLNPRAPPSRFTLRLIRHVPHDECLLTYRQLEEFEGSPLWAPKWGACNIQAMSPQIPSAKCSLPCPAHVIAAYRITAPMHQPSEAFMRSGWSFVDMHSGWECIYLHPVQPCP
eukprot:819638-Pelagomonas_calceolata.AAC.1